MRVAALTVPGRFPTVTYDPGGWWSRLVALGAAPTLHSVNATWWRALCSPGGAGLLAAPRYRLWRRIKPRDLHPAAAAAGRALEALKQPSTYDSPEEYLAAVGSFAEYLALLNRVQDELVFHIDFGVRVEGLDYGDSRSLVDYARRDTRLAELVAAALPAIPVAPGLLVVAVSRPEELLTALLTVRLLKDRSPGLHACLADHGHENFSLTPHLARLRQSGTFESIFDTIIESKDDRDDLVPEIASALAAGRAPRGYLSRPARRHDVEGAAVSQPAPPETFSPQPVMWTRLSPRRCYWDRCTFCALNAKYADPAVPSAAELPHALDRLEAIAEAGYRIVNFGDEALSPALVERLCRGMLERGLDLRWACCCKLESCYGPELFALMRAAGCYEIFWGLESASPRVLRLMDKEVHGLDLAGVRRIFEQANEAGIGIHVSLMAAFPGDTPGEASDSVEFAIEALRDASNATFNLNRFMLLEGSPIMADPARFGVVPLPPAGDMPFERTYRLASGIAGDAATIDRLLPGLTRRLYERLGWDRFGSGPGPDTAVDLHFFFGHGSIFKIRGDHPFVNPLREPALADA